MYVREGHKNIKRNSMEELTGPKLFQPEAEQGYRIYLALQLNFQPSEQDAHFKNRNPKNTKKLCTFLSFSTRPMCLIGGH